MPDSSFLLKAVVRTLEFEDTFTRVDANDWGSDYTVDFLSGGATLSIDGSVGRLSPDESVDLALSPPDDKRIRAGMVEFDFFVGSDPTDDWFLELEQGGEHPFEVFVYQDSGATWNFEWITFYGPSANDVFASFTAQANTWYRCEISVSGITSGPATIRVWKIGDPVPVFEEGQLPEIEDALLDPDDWFEPRVSFSSATAESLGFDNLRLWTFGEPDDPQKFGTFTFNAVKKRADLSGSYSLDAVVGDRFFTLDAWLIGGRLRHDRSLDHFGTQPTTVIVLDGPIGKYEDGAVLHDVLADMIDRISDLESGTHYAFGFSFDAFIDFYLTLDAVIYDETSVTFTMDAWFARGATFTIDASLIIRASATFTLDAWLIDSPNGTWEEETATPIGDGITTIFTVPEYAAGTTTVYVDGIPTSDYVELDPDAGTIQFNSPPGVGAVITVHARYCV